MPRRFHCIYVQTNTITTIEANIFSLASEFKFEVQIYKIKKDCTRYLNFSFILNPYFPKLCLYTLCSLHNTATKGFYLKFCAYQKQK